MSPSQQLDPVSQIDAHTHMEQLARWRSAAGRVARAWDVWLASDQAERDWAHDVYLDALDREEQAALRLERAVRALDERP